MQFSIPSGTIKFILGWMAVFLFRLILLPVRPPNFEPLMGAMMPFSKRYGILATFSFGFFAIVIYDAVTSGWGIWTWVTAACYGLLGVGAYYFFKNREASVKNFLTFGIPATLLYDAVTMMIGPLFSTQLWSVALLGQIPFTIMHLISTVFFATVLSPVLYRWVIQNDALEFSVVQSRALAFFRAR